MITTYDFSEPYTGTDFPGGNNRQRLLEAIVDLGSEATRRGDINTLAIRLSTKFPQSGLTIDDICRRIERAFKGRAESGERA